MRFRNKEMHCVSKTIRAIFSQYLLSIDLIEVFFSIVIIDFFCSNWLVVVTSIGRFFSYFSMELPPSILDLLEFLFS